MARFPALPLWTDAFLADTMHLSRHERGDYLQLLILMWRTPGCRVPNDKAWICKRLGYPIENYEDELMPLIREFCITDGNWVTQKRLTKEFEFVGRQSVRAKSRWDKKKVLCHDGVVASAPTSDRDLQAVPENSVPDKPLFQNGNGACHDMGVAYAPTPTPTPLKKESKISPNGDLFQSESYAFEDGIIRLNQKDFDRWKKAYSNLSLEAELLAMSEWAQEQGKNWFHAVKGLLTKRNREATLKLRQPAKESFSGIA